MSEARFLVRYTGTVQGVGFRAETRRLASGYAVKGWVKNEPDGSVQMIVAAEAGECEAFLKAIRESRLGGHIHREVLEPTARVDFGGSFDVRS